MTTDDDELIEVAAAIADGTPMDWRGLEATAHTPEARARIRRLECVAGIGRFHTNRAHAQPEDSATPVSWGPLTIIEKIGRGTFGDVYRARETRLDRDVALKLLRHKDTTTDPDEVIEEARLLARVHHPNVTTIYGAERIDGRVGLWMEFVNGGTLEDELLARGRFDADELRRVGADVAAALSAVHHAGLLHRDVKTQNVMRCADGRVKLTDFGTGRPRASQSHELVDELAGSPLYLAPEIVKGGTSTIQSDVYSLGVLLYRLATGLYPVPAKTLHELTEAHAAGRHTRLAEARPDLPAAVTTAIDRALAMNPAARPAPDELGALLAARKTPSRLREWALVAAGVIALITWWAVRSLPVGSQAVGSEQTVMTGQEVNQVIAVSPDGRLTAFVDGSGNIGVRDGFSGPKRRLTTSGSTESTYRSAERAVFSPDSHRLAYSWLEDTDSASRYSLRIIDIDRPVETPAIYTSLEIDWMAPLAWSPDGQFIAIAVERDLVTDIARVSVTGGDQQILATADWRGVNNMAFSPDGRYLAYDAVPSEVTAERDVYVVATNGSNPHPLVTGSGRDSLVGWSADPSAVVFSSDRRGSMSLWQQPVIDGAPQGEPSLLAADIHDGTFGLTQDGRVFYRVTTRDQPILAAAFDLKTGAMLAPVTTPIRSGFSDHRKPIWSPDGRSFAYISATSPDEPTSPTQRILSIETDGVRRLLSVRLARWYASSWAPDGRSLLAFGLDFHRRVGVFRVDVSTGEVAPLIVAHNGIFAWMPQWANDGRHFYYMRGPYAWDADLSTEFVERDMNSGKDRVLFRNRDLKRPDGTAAPALRDWTVSPDGKSVAALETNGRKYHALWIKSLEGLEAREIYRVASDCQVPITHFALAWTPDSRGLLINAATGCKPAQRALWVVPVTPGPAPRKLDTGSYRLLNEPPAIGPGGQIAFRAGDDPTYEIRVLKLASPGR